MAHYLLQASYTSQTIGDLVANPQDRSVPLRALIEQAGGTLHSFYYAFGDYDIVGIAEVPDNVTMAALAMAVGAGGALREFKTTVLIPMSDAVDAMRRASTVGYRPPAR